MVYLVQRAVVARRIEEDDLVLLKLLTLCCLLVAVDGSGKHYGARKLVGNIALNILSALGNGSVSGVDILAVS